MKLTQLWNPKVLLDFPLYAPLRQVIQRLVRVEFPNLADWNSLLLSHYPGITVKSGLPLHFVGQEQGKLGFESQYEPRCYLSGEVQTREKNWHDLFNAMVWLSFPKSKAAINSRHYDALQGAAKLAVQDKGASQRGKVRDMATLLDESGVIVACAEEELAELLCNFKWKELFWQRRAQLKAGMDFYVFGHGIYEKALDPYIGMTGQGLVIMVERKFFNWPLLERLVWLDQCVASYLNAPEHCISTKELHPVPLLGMPGWTVMNESESFYDNTAYFRPGRGRAL